MKALTTGPVACEPSAPEKPDDRSRQLTLGRLAFESPALLGGAAARMGLSCSSCHINGRGNPDFFISGVSGAPGTADVTSSLFSKVRGNGAFDPVPIPDLAMRDGTQMKDRTSTAFADKVRGLIAEEFDGQEPPPYVFEAVLLYLDSLDAAHCESPDAVETLSVMDDAGAVLSALVPVESDAPPEVALFYARVARERLERMYERFAGQTGNQAAILSLSDKIAERASEIREGRPPQPIIFGQLSRVLMLVQSGEARSLYNPDALRTALATRSAP